MSTSYWKRRNNCPTPKSGIPIIIGGSGRRTLELVSRYATWWNLPVIDLPRLEELLPRIGEARISAQAFVTVIEDPTQRDQLLEKARRRYGSMLDGRQIAGTPDELIVQFEQLKSLGVERVFTDFSPPSTPRLFGREVASIF